ncbi:armadillo-type protein [Trichoderma austrokoningii]
MASSNGIYNPSSSSFSTPQPQPQHQHQQHQRAKPSVLKFIHRRDQSSSDAAMQPPKASPLEAQFSNVMPVGNFARNNPGALGELQHNQQEPAPRPPPRKSRDERRPDPEPESRSADSPTKKSLFLSMNTSKSRESSPTKNPKKAKSGTSLTGLLGRPKTVKSLHKLMTDGDEVRSGKDKENRMPVEPPHSATLPVYAQFASNESMNSLPPPSPSRSTRESSERRSMAKERSRPFMYPTRSQQDIKKSSIKSESPNGTKSDSFKGKSIRERGKVFGTFASFGHGRSKSETSTPRAGSPPAAVGPVLDLKDINKQLEALLDRRNIPENQRYKMRNLSDTIKMEFIRQDWAEMRAAKLERKQNRPRTSMSSSVNGGAAAAAAAAASASTSAVVSDAEEEKPKRTRGRSFTFSRAKKEKEQDKEKGRSASKNRSVSKNRSSSKKSSKSESTLGRHFRNKSADSVASDNRPTSSANSSASSGLLSKIKLQQGPADYVAYLRKVRQPQQVEVGKLHKLRLLLRNETVAWIEEFIQQGGMKEIVGLLNRIMEVEWREEHEDALLHENLLCLKALSTTARAMEYLHSVQADLFPKLLHMLFDPEKKGPSEFTTRNIITSVLYTYIESASTTERVIRARSILRHLRDPEPDESTRPLPFVLEMRQERPYRVWCKEVVSVTKEVFWIFLHHLNVVALTPETDAPGDAAAMSRLTSNEDQQYAYMRRHFPQEKAPVPAAPYVGGVEWDATNYLASHLDLMNAILACTLSAEERNKLRADLRISGWERCMGGSLRLCKEKFYGSVHTGLRTWVAAAADDKWDVKDVRYGPPAEARSPVKANVPRKKAEDAPKIDMPKLDFGSSKVQPRTQTHSQKKPPPKDGWL